MQIDTQMMKVRTQAIMGQDKATPQLIDWITRELKRRHWSAVKLSQEATKAGKPVTHPTIYGLINSTVEPRPSTLEAIAAGFRVDPQVLRDLQYPPDKGLAAEEKFVIELRGIISGVPKDKRALFLQLVRGMADEMRRDI